MSRKNIKDDAVKFSKDRQPSKEARIRGAKKTAETKAKRRELSDLLNLVIKGEFGKEINQVLTEKLGMKASTIEEALHFVQIAKAIGKDDTQAYMALMQTSGLNKAVKTEVSGVVSITTITGMTIL